MSICVECQLSFFQDPVKVGIFVGFLMLALVLFVFLRTLTLNNKQKIGLMYAHLFSLVFPFIFFAMYRGCVVVVNYCSTIPRMAFLIGITAIVSLILGMMGSNFLFKRKYIKKSLSLKNNFIENFVKSEIDNVKVYIVDLARPFAFSIHKTIFVSMGLADILSKNELKAVLLHEVYHIKSQGSLLKFTSNLTRFISPLFNFNHEMCEEERLADQYAIKNQGTSKYLNSAKSKVNEFHSETFK